ncbi:hypothetical protein ITP53_46905, partial [Nonomuraea sp. K274]
AVEEERRQLAEAQGRVVAALVAGADPPEGFDQERLRVQAASLIAKRRAVVARIRPDVAVAAGPDLASEFAAYARARTTPPPGYRADADDFAAWLRGRGRLPGSLDGPRSGPLDGTARGPLDGTARGTLGGLRRRPLLGRPGRRRWWARLLP